MIVPSMSKSQFALIAETIRSLLVPERSRRNIAEHFASALTATNQQFKRELFIAACMRPKE